MNKTKSRTYSNDKRAAGAARTEQKILKVLGELWLEYSIHEITMEMIAARSGVTVRTILRKFGSKEGLYEAALKHDVTGIRVLKDQTRVGDVDHIAAMLMQEYEWSGMAGIRTLALEGYLDLAAQILRKGREFHTAWCERVFEPFLPADPVQRRIMIGALYSVTDINKWKLLRKDLGYSAAETEEIFKKIIQGTIHTFNPNS